MKSFLVVALLALASPALAQIGPECRGKPQFQLSGGVYGCLNGIEPSSYRRTTYWDDGFTSKTRQVQSARVEVLLYGEPSTSYKSYNQIKSRVQAICKTFDASIKEAMAGEKYTDVIVAMVWPRVPVSSKNGGKKRFLTHSGFTTKRCSGAKLFNS